MDLPVRVSTHMFMPGDYCRFGMPRGLGGAGERGVLVVFSSVLPPSQAAGAAAWRVLVCLVGGICGCVGQLGAASRRERLRDVGWWRLLLLWWMGSPSFVDLFGCCGV